MHNPVWKRRNKKPSLLSDCTRIHERIKYFQYTKATNHNVQISNSWMLSNRSSTISSIIQKIYVTFIYKRLFRIIGWSLSWLFFGVRMKFRITLSMPRCWRWCCRYYTFIRLWNSGHFYMKLLKRDRNKKNSMKTKCYSKCRVLLLFFVCCMYVQTWIMIVW